MRFGPFMGRKRMTLSSVLRDTSQRGRAAAVGGIDCRCWATGDAEGGEPKCGCTKETPDDSPDGIPERPGNVAEPMLRPEQQTGSCDDGLFVIPLRNDLMNTLGQVPAAIRVLGPTFNRAGGNSVTILHSNKKRAS